MPSSEECGDNITLIRIRCPVLFLLHSITCNDTEIMMRAFKRHVDDSIDAVKMKLYEWKKEKKDVIVVLT